MMRHDLPEAAWQRSSYSSDNGGQCVEAQTTSDGRVAVRDSKNRALGAHTFASTGWENFLAAIRGGAL